MGKFILENSNVHYVLNNVQSMYEDLINKPQVGTDPDVGIKCDLEVANGLLATLEQMYSLRIGSRGMGSKACGFETESMLEAYRRMKHWQRMLNIAYGDRADIPQQRPEEGPSA